jgi:hypothetical protein
MTRGGSVEDTIRSVNLMVQIRLWKPPMSGRQQHLIEGKIGRAQSVNLIYARGAASPKLFTAFLAW